MEDIEYPQAVYQVLSNLDPWKKAAAGADPAAYPAHFANHH
jgi:hypothetical protein